MPPITPPEENDNENILVDATLIQNEKLDELNDSNDAQVQGIIQTNDHLEELNSGVDVLIEKLSQEKEPPQLNTKFSFEVDGAEIQTIEGPKGEDGKDGISPDKNEIVKEVVSIVTPQIPTVQEIVSRIPVPKNGIDGRDGAVGERGERGLQGFPGIGKTGERGPAGKDGKDAPEVAVDKLVEEIKQSFPIEEIKKDVEGVHTRINKIASKTYDKSEVGLSEVDNTSDNTKNSAVATLTNKTLASPAIIGNTEQTGGIPTVGGDGVNTGAIQLKPANPNYNWYSLVNKEAGASEGFAIQAGVYPSVIVTPFACTRAGVMTTPLGTVSQLGYERQLNGAGSSSSPMLASTAYYFGNFSTQFFPTTSATVNRVYIPRTGSLKRADIIFRTGSGTPSSAELLGLYLRVDNTTDYTLDTTSLRTDVANSVYFSSVTVNIPLTAGSYFNIKMVTPAWSVVANYPYVEVRLYIE